MQNGFKADYIRQSEDYAAIVGTHAYLGERTAFVSCKGDMSPDFRLQVLDGVWIVGKRYREGGPGTRIVCVSREQAARIAVAHLMGE